MEALEDRIVPQGSSFNQDFVTQIYTELLHRNVDSGGLANWTGELAAGVSTTNVVLGIESTAEYRNDVVEQLYQSYLGRNADAGGLSHWSSALASESIEHVEAGIIGSTEFYDRAGGTNQGFLNALYADVLHRSVDSDGEAGFMAALNSGVSLGTVAYDVIMSPEGLSDRVTADYEQYLHRAPDSGGLQSFVSALENGASDQEVIAVILSSTESETRTPAAPVVTSPSEATTVTTTTDSISGTAENGSLVQIFSDGNVVGSEQLVGSQTAFSITVPLTANAANHFTVTATNDFGKQSPATTVPTITQGASTPAVTVTTPAKQMNHEGNTVSLTIAATDSSGKTLTYTATGLPPGLTIDSSTGVISGTVTTGDAANSPYTVTVTATDTSSATGTATFTWLIDNTTNPTVTAPSNQTNSEGASVSGVDVTATEPNKNPLTYSATGLPAGLSINSTTGVISGTIGTGDSSSSPYTVTVSATDGLNTGTATFTWTITPVVTITAPPNQTNIEGGSVSGVTVTASDAKGGTLVFSASNLPAGLSINPTSGIISGTISDSDASGSPYTVTVSASDGTYSRSATFTWTVHPVVTLTAPAAQTSTEGATITNVSGAATDSNSGTLTYTASNLPAGLSINPSTGEISGTIGSTAATGSPYTVTYSATDGTFSNSATFTWTINPAVVVTPPMNQASRQGATISGVAATATDSTSGTLNYVASGLPAGISIDPTTGQFTGTIGDSDATTNPYMVTITASDGTYSGSASFIWTVVPVITVTAPASQTNAVGDTVSGVAVTATDSSQGTLTYIASGLPAGLTINSSTGVISGAINAGDAAGSPYTVTVTASDGTFTGSNTFTWNVTSAIASPLIDDPLTATSVSTSTFDVTGTAPANSLVTILQNGTSVGTQQLTGGATSFSITVPLTASSANSFTATASDAAGGTSAATTIPVITQSTNVVTVTTPNEQKSHEGATANLAINATNSGGGTLSYSATGLPGGLTINSTSGLITGTIATGDSTSSPYDVTVTATAGTNSGTASFTWLVDNSTAPVVTTAGNQTNTEGDAVSGVTITASQNNTNPLTYSASGLPAGLSIDPTTGSISGTIDPSAASGSPYTVTVTASDGLNSGTGTFTWTVNPVISITNPGNQTNVEGDSVSVNIAATDSLSNSLTYLASGLPAGLTIDSSTGDITGTIAAGDASTTPYSITVTVTDGTYRSSVSLSWTVNPAVVVTAPANQTSSEGAVITGVNVTATDSTSGTLIYSAKGLPSGLSIDSSTGAISGIIDNNTASTTPYTVTVAATDGTYTGKSSFTWTINPAVTVSSPGSQTSAEGSTPSITITASDSTQNTLSFSATGLPAGLSIGKSTGIITGTVDSGDATKSPYTVTVTATDGSYSGTTSFTYTITPVVTITAPANQTGNEGDTVSGVSVTATDSLGHTLTYAATGLPTGLSINSSTGAITGTLATGDSSDSPLTVTVTATDDTYSNAATFTWTIAPSNTPIITVPATQKNVVGATISGVSVSATGAGTLTYSATGLPSGLTINSSTGAITGTIATGDSADSPYNVVVSVSNGTKTGTASFAWVVTTSSTSTLPFSLTSPNWQTLPSGVRIWDVTTGGGAVAALGDTITVNFTGYLTDGTQFPGGTGTNFSSALNTASLIAGWVDGIPGQKVGGERRLDIPSSLAYGDNPPSGSGIPDNAELIFDITLTAVSPPSS